MKQTTALLLSVCVLMHAGCATQTQSRPLTRYGVFGDDGRALIDCLVGRFQCTTERPAPGFNFGDDMRGATVQTFSTNSTQVLIVGEDGLIKIVRGNSIGINTAPTNEDLSAVDAGIAISVAWAVGDDGTVIKHSGNSVSLSSNWTMQTSGTSEDLKGVAAVNANIAWAVGDNGTILRTDNGGARWRTQVSGTGDDLRAVYAVDEITAWAVGEDGLILHTSNGRQWTRQFPPTLRSLNAVFAVNRNTVWAAGDDGSIVRTDDGGQQWRGEQSNTDEHLRGITARSEEEAVAVGDNGTFISTTGNGLWTPQRSGTTLDLEAVVIMKRF